MSDERLIRQAAPTLAGIKTGSLFPCAYTDREKLLRQVRGLNRRLGAKGLCLVLLRWGEGNALLYLFRPSRLEADLAGEEARALLRELGYADAGRQRCLCELARRLRSRRDFPHEIGLFLSYPPEDVRGFIEHQGKDCKAVGCWKVYGDAERAEKRFDAYKRCTANYLSRFAAGASVEALTV